MGIFSSLLPEKFRSVTAWNDFAVALEQLLDSNVLVPVRKMLDLRRPRFIEAGFLTHLASLLGFRLKADLFNENDYRRVISSLPEYYQKAGTIATPAFMGYTRNTVIQIVPLWSEDYINFYESPTGATIYDGGTWYLTPHVNLVYDPLISGAIPVQTVLDLFRAFAPINLVLDLIIQIPVYTRDMQNGYDQSNNLYYSGGYYTEITEI